MLSQITPMLESVLASRMGGRAEAERTQAGLAEIGSNHAALLTELQRQGGDIARLTEELRASQATVGTLLARFDEQDRKQAALAAAVRNAGILLSGLLLLCLILLVVLLVRHA